MNSLLKIPFFALFIALGSLSYSQTTVSTYAGLNGAPGYTDGDTITARFYNPVNIVYGKGGYFYITDTYNHCIRKISNTGVVTTLAGDGTPGYADGQGTAARFHYPYGLAIDKHDYLYISDVWNHRIRRVSPNGDVITIAGSGPYGSIGVGGYADGSLGTAIFNNPSGIYADFNDTVIYVAENEGARVRKIDFNNNTVSTLAGTGITGYQDGPGNTAKFNQLTAIIADDNGNLYVGDRNNNCIRKIDVNGNVTTIAGSTSAGFSDGQGSNAAFNHPRGLYYDRCLEKIYIADRYNHALRVMDLNGNVVTVAGTGFAGTTNGDVSVAQFNEPSGMILYNGDLFVCDKNNHAIRRVSNVETCSVGTEELTAENTFQFDLYPNPTESSITISISSPLYDFEDLSYIIYSLEGKKILDGNIQKNNTLINTSNVSSGMYQLSIVSVEKGIIALNKLIIAR